MKKMLFIPVFSLLFSLSNVSAGENASTAPKAEVQTEVRVLKGVVSDKLTSETLAGAVITADGEKVYTDLDGNFTLPRVCGDKCTLTISLISYADQTLEIDTRNTNKPLQVKLEQR